MKLKWKKQAHALWGEGKKEEIIRTIVPSMHWPKDQWLSGEFSIIYPRPDISSTPPRYELFDGDEVWIFDTLKEAKEKAEQLN